MNILNSINSIMRSGKKKHGYKNFNDLTDDKILNIDLSWMYNLQLYDKIQ